MAGIYIPNMNIPEEEQDGTMSGTLLLILSNGKAQIIRTKEIIDVIPVPDHGRLIDADFIARIDMMPDDAPTIIPADKESEK